MVIYFLIPLLIIIVPPSLFFLYLVLTEYKPEDIEEAIRYRKSKDGRHFTSYNIMTYNIGYCGNDEQTIKENERTKYSVKINQETVYDNLIAMTNIIKDINPEFVLLQEVDQASARSGKVDQVEYITSEITDMNSSFAYNFNAFVPFPLSHPVGGTHSGLVNLSKYQAMSSKRYQLDGKEEFPRSLFFLKRCMLVEEYNLPNKKLILINIHFSSYDKDNLFRTEQFHHMMRFLEDTYDGRKNAIIVGGDFNYLLNKDSLDMNTPHWLERLPEEFYNSKFKAVFPKKGFSANQKGYKNTIDGFIVSQNVKVMNCEIYDDQFVHSNHNPVRMTFTI